MNNVINSIIVRTNSADYYGALRLNLNVTVTLITVMGTVHILSVTYQGIYVIHSTTTTKSKPIIG